MKSMRCMSILLLTLVSMSARAQDETPPAADPRLAQLQAELALLTAKASIAEKEALIAKSRFGEPAATPTGTIGTPEKFLAFGQWALADVYDDIGAHAATLSTYKDKCPHGYFVTSLGDRSERLIAAGIVKDKIDRYTLILDNIQRPTPPGATPSPAAALPAVVGALSGLLGSADKLVGMFRADYAISDASADVDAQAARLAAATGLRTGTGNINIIVEGLDQRSTGGALVTAYEKFFNALQDARRRYASALARATTDDQKAKLAGDNALITAAGSLDSALTTSDAGSMPLIGLAHALESKERCTLVVHFSGIKTSLITRKRLLSRNDKLIAVSGGTVLMVLFEADGDVLDSKRLTIDRRIAGRLDEIAKSATPIGPR